MLYQSNCRNCRCLHFYGEDSVNYPRNCYCPEAFYGIRRCTHYIPSENLEYLEWILEYGV